MVEGRCQCDEKQWAAHQAIHAIELREREGTRHTMAERLDGMNHLQSKLDAITQNTVAREWYEREHGILVNQISQLRATVANIEGRLIVLYLILGAFVSATVVEIVNRR